MPLCCPTPVHADLARREGGPEDGLEGLNALTARELQVLVLVARGMSNAQIAAALGLSEGNMKSRVNRVLTRSYVERRVTKGHTRREAIRYLNRCVARDIYQALIAGRKNLLEPTPPVDVHRSVFVLLLCTDEGCTELDRRGAELLSQVLIEREEKNGVAIALNESSAAGPSPLPIRGSARPSWSV